MACSLPIIVSKATPWKCISENGAGFWIDCSVEKLVESLKLLYDNHQLRKSMGERPNQVYVKCESSKAIPVSLIEY